MLVHAQYVTTGRKKRSIPQSQGTTFDNVSILINMCIHLQSTNI